MPTMRPRFQWNIGRRSLPLGERTLVMGVLNVTPDSFSDGGNYLDPGAAIAHGLALLDQGADILDIGGESTRPGVATASAQAPALAGAVSAQQEIDRVLPVIEAIKHERPGSVLSIDTYKSTVARSALHAGAEIVNDVSGLTWDPSMAATLAAHPCGAVLMHVRGLPHQWRTLAPVSDLVSLVRQELGNRLARALDAGVARDSIVLDPGFGFGKNFKENYSLLARLAEFHLLGFPLLVGLSRKSFLARTVATRLSELANEPAGAPHQSANAGAPPLPQSADVGSPATLNPATPNPASLDTATLSANVAAALAGAHIIRVHAVAGAFESLAIADAILAAQPSS
jgi:dihydropteroate synthase